MVDETKPPKGWSLFVFGDGSSNAEIVTPNRIITGGVTLRSAHEIARGHAQPYVAEALERIAFWATSADAYHEWHRDDADADMPAWLTRQFLAMARGERPLPGSEGR